MFLRCSPSAHSIVLALWMLSSMMSFRVLGKQPISKQRPVFGPATSTFAAFFTPSHPSISSIRSNNPHNYGDAKLHSVTRGRPARGSRSIVDSSSYKRRADLSTQTTTRFTLYATNTAKEEGKTTVQDVSKIDIIPRAAVSVVVRAVVTKTIPEHQQQQHNNTDQHQHQDKNNVRYVLVQRGKKPNRGIWSLPGGKIELGECTLDAAKRELFEETKLGHVMDINGLNNTGLLNGVLQQEEMPGEDDTNNENDKMRLQWHPHGPFTCTDSIHVADCTDNHVGKVDKSLSYHYLIAQCFAEVVMIQSSTANINSMNTVQEEEEEVVLSTTISNLPQLVPSDDAMDAKWFHIHEIQEGIKKGTITASVDRVIERAEALYSRGLLTTV